MNRRVDQKLHATKLILAAIDANPSISIISATKIALTEAALFHIHVAYRAYLHELLQHCNAIIDVETAQDAVALLRSRQIFSSDIDELAKLERSGAWPAQLCAAYAGIVCCEEKKEAAPNNDIALHDVTAQIDSKALTAWLQQFFVLLNRQRQHAHEW